MTAIEDRTRSRFRRTISDIFHERTNFQFIARSWRWGLVSGVLVAISLGGLAINGLNLGIEFDGGTQWQFTREAGVLDPDDVRDVLADTPASEAKVLVLGTDGARVQAETLKPAQREAVTEALATYAGIDVGDVSVTEVGPTWGDRVTRKAVVALVVLLSLIALYLTFRFEWRMAISAILAVVHDVIVTVGVYAVTGFEVTPATVVAFLTILGFSLYDTVVVFDKIRENAPSTGTERGDTYSNMVNRSMNQVLMRSLNTTFVALLPVASLLVVGSVLLGGVTLRDFALALFVGLAAGAYSSIFVATPILAQLKEREPRYRGLRERSSAYAARAPGAAIVPPGATSPSPEEFPAPAPPREPMPGVIAPRPRQQRRRKRR